MLLTQGRNILCTFRVTTAPEYVEKSKNSGKTFMHVKGYTKSSENDGMAEDLAYELLIFGDAAIPASKTILPGALLLVGGRTESRQGRKKDWTVIFVDFWFPIVRDPYHYTDVIEAQMKMLTQMHLGNFYKALGNSEEEGENGSDEAVETE